MSSAMLIDGRFVAVFPRLVRALDGDMLAAAILQSIHYRAQARDAKADPWMLLPVGELADEVGLSDDQAQRATQRLVDRGLVAKQSQRGVGTRWRIDYDAVAELQQGEEDFPRNRGSLSADSRKPFRDIADDSLYTEEEEVTRKPGAPAPAHEVDAQTEGQRVNRLTCAYTDRVPLSNFPAVAGIVRKAVRAGLWADDEIGDALARLGDEGRAVTTDSLRYELVGFAGPRSNRERQLRDGITLARDLAQPDPWAARELEAGDK